MAYWTPTKKDDPRCKCVDGQYECGHCEAEAYRGAGRRMSQSDHAYDRMVLRADYNSRPSDAAQPKAEGA